MVGQQTSSLLFEAGCGKQATPDDASNNASCHGGGGGGGAALMKPRVNHRHEESRTAGNSQKQYGKLLHCRHHSAGFKKQYQTTLQIRSEFSLPVPSAIHWKKATSCQHRWPQDEYREKAVKMDRFLGFAVFFSSLSSLRNSAEGSL